MRPPPPRYLGVEHGDPTMREAVEALVGPITCTELGWNPRQSLADNLRRSGPAVR